MKIVDASGNPVRSDDEFVESTTLESVVYDRINPRQVGTGAVRGTQTVGYGNTKIDGSNNRITVGDSIELGTSSSDVDSYGLAIYDTSGVKRLFGGRFSDGDVKIKLSQATYDVGTATDDQLIWSSDFNLFKIVASGSAIVNLPGGYAANTYYNAVVTHSLGYVPTYLSFVTFPAGAGGQRQDAQHVGVDALAGLPISNNASVIVDSSSITLSVIANGSAVYSGDWTFKYYLIRETIT